jgi:hypothetical protein
MDYLVLGKYPDTALEAADTVQLKKDIAALVSHLEQFESAI